MSLLRTAPAPQGVTSSLPINSEETTKPSTTDNEKDALLQPKEVAARLGVGVGLLRTWRLSGSTGPRAMVLSPRVIRYRTADVEAWLASRTTGGEA